MLALSGVRVGYGRIEVLHGLDLTVGEGEIVTVIGANGSGKSTLLKAISGMVDISQGSIEFDGTRLDGTSVEGIVRRGVVQIPEGRQLFGPLSVEENLQLGGYARRRARSGPANMRRVCGGTMKFTLTRSGFSRSFRACASAGASWPARCRAGSSRCWRSLAP